MSATSPHILDSVLDLLVDTVCVVNAEGRFVFISASCEQLLGYTQQELLGRAMIDLVFPDDRERTLKAAAAVMDGRSHIHFENRYRRKDGSIVDIMWSARWSESQQLRFAVARDITAIKYAERKQAALYAIAETTHVAKDLPTLYQHIHQIINGLLPSDIFCAARYDAATNMLSFPYFSGFPSEEPAPRQLDVSSRLATVIKSGQTLLLTASDLGLEPVQSLANIEHYQEWLGAPLLTPNAVIGVLVMARRTGGKAYTEKDRELLHFVSMQVGTTIERKQAEARLKHLADHDPLTNLPNRMLFQDRFDMALKLAHRYQQRVALLYLDLDDFKKINDNFGHQVGDLFLFEMAKRLLGVVRESDTVGRISGDEFAVLINNIQGPKSVETVRKKIIAAIERPLVIAEQHLEGSASIGVALYPDHGNTTKALFRYADDSMYQSKRH